MPLEARLCGQDTPTSDRWHASLELLLPVISLQTCGFRRRSTPLPLLPGTQPLETQPPTRQTLDSKDTRSPSPHALESPFSTPSVCFDCRLFVLTISQVPSPISTQDSAPVPSPPSASPQVPTPLRRPPAPVPFIQSPSPAPTSPARATQRPTIPALGPAGPSRSA